MSAVATREAALALANKTRLERSAIKRQIRARDLTVLDALEAPACQGMSVYVLLASQRGWGGATYTAQCWRPLSVLSRIGATPYLTVEKLTARQKALIKAELPSNDGPLNKEAPWST
jgi:hypothetical protein